MILDRDVNSVPADLRFLKQLNTLGLSDLNIEACEVSQHWKEQLVQLICKYESESESESALFAKCVQTHKEFVVVFKKLLVHTCIHT